MRLAIETASRHAAVVLGGPAGVAASVVRQVEPGRGTPLLSLVEEALSLVGAGMGDVEALGVGTGPGSFTGLRAGLATAKTLSWRRGLPLVALPTDDTLRRAAAIADPSLGAPAVVVLPAGARDHYLALPGVDPVLVPPGADLAALAAGGPVVALDVTRAGVVADLATATVGAGHPDPLELGMAALGRLPEALLQAMGERIASSLLEDPATLVPRYVALPRGLAAAPAEAGTTITDATRRDEAWSPTRR